MEDLKHIKEFNLFLAELFLTQLEKKKQLYSSSPGIDSEKRQVGLIEVNATIKTIKFHCSKIKGETINKEESCQKE